MEKTGRKVLKMDMKCKKSVVWSFRGPVTAHTTFGSDSAKYFTIKKYILNLFKGYCSTRHN